MLMLQRRPMSNTVSVGEDRRFVERFVAQRNLG